MREERWEESCLDWKQLQAPVRQNWITCWLHHYKLCPLGQLLYFLCLGFLICSMG